MKQVNWIFASLLCLACTSSTLAQTDQPGRRVFVAQTTMALSQQRAEKDDATLDAQREKRALQIFLMSVEKQIVSVADAMPADKYGFAPTAGEFKGVRTFGQQVKHLAATNLFWPRLRWGRSRRPTPVTKSDQKQYGPKRRFSIT